MSARFDQTFEGIKDAILPEKPCGDVFPGRTEAKFKTKPIFVNIGDTEHQVVMLVEMQNVDGEKIPFIDVHQLRKQFEKHVGVLPRRVLGRRHFQHHGAQPHILRVIESMYGNEYFDLYMKVYLWQPPLGPRQVETFAESQCSECLLTGHNSTVCCRDIGTARIHYDIRFIGYTR